MNPQNHTPIPGETPNPQNTVEVPPIAPQTNTGPEIQPGVEVQPQGPGQEAHLEPQAPIQSPEVQAPELQTTTPEPVAVEESQATNIVEGAMPRYEKLKSGDFEPYDIARGYVEMDEKDTDALGIKEDNAA